MSRTMSETEPMSESSRSKALNTFSVKLLKAMVGESGLKDNLLVSPVGVSSCLSMLLLGSKGKTEDQLFRGLCWDLALIRPQEVHAVIAKVLAIFAEDMFEPKPFNLFIANRVLVQKDAASPVGENFKRSLCLVYQTTVEDVDFCSDGLRIQEDCNRFAKDKTMGNIDTILDSPPKADTAAILLNAVYFKGKWEIPFDSTSPGMFFNNGFEGDAKDGVLFMNQWDTLFNLGSGFVFGGEEADILEMPYEGDLSMFIILPKSMSGLERMAPNISYAQIESHYQMMYIRKVNVTLPKFKFESSKELNSTLNGMGITDPFIDGKADLSGINGAGNLYLSQVVHKATVNCAEVGTEATVVTMAKSSPSTGYVSVSFDFVADHPFLFFIRENKSKAILFMGTAVKF